MAWSAVRIGDIATAQNGPYEAAWKPVRHHFGIRAFGVNAWIADREGQELVEVHDEADGDGGHEELYAIVAGRATFTVDGERVDAPAGTLIHVGDPRIVRSAIAEEPGTTVFCVGAEPGTAFTPSDWETHRL